MHPPDRDAEPTARPSGAASRDVPGASTARDDPGPPGADPSELARARGELMRRMFGDPVHERVLGRYRIVRKLGTGGMGVVYLGHDPRLGRNVAIKVLASGPLTAAARGRLQHEARAAARLRHANVVEVFDVGLADDVPFVVMELVEGGTLTEWLAARRRSVAQIVDALGQAGRGLAAAHACGLLHRDFKPGNVLVGRDGRMRVADFGLAIQHELGATTPPELPDDPLASTIEFGGTPAFMPPEQHADAPLDARADVYAFCVTAYLALHGELPFRGNPAALYGAKLAYDGAAPSRSRIDPRLHAVIARGMHPDRQQRPASVDEVCAAMRAVAGRRVPWRAGLAAFAAVGLVGWMARDAERAECDGARALGPAWNDARRNTLVADPELALGDVAAVISHLDSAADTWIATYDATCALPPGRQRDMAMACLDRDRRALATLTEVLADAERDVAVRARGLVDELHPSDRCGEDPDDGDVDPVREQILGRLAEARVLEDAGREHEARTIVDELLDRARAHGDARAVGRCAVAAARLASRAGDTALAHERGEESLATALAAGDDATAFSAALELTWIDGVDGNAPERGEARAKEGEAILARMPDDVVRRAKLEKQRAAVWATAGDLERARAGMLRAVELAQRGDDELLQVDLRHDLATIDVHAGRAAEAVGPLREVVAWYERELGPHHPELADALANLAQAELAVADGVAARAAAARAVEVGRAGVGPDHPTTIDALGVQVHVLTMLEDVDAALPLAEEALAAMQRRYGDHDRKVAALETRYADLLGQSGRFAEAVGHAEHARVVAQELFGGDSTHYADATHFLARIVSQSPDGGTAEALFREAERVFLGAGDGESAVIVVNDLATSLADHGDPDAAVRELERVWARAQALGEASITGATTGFELAFYDQGRALAERRALVLRAKRVWQGAGITGASMVELERWLAAHPGTATR